MKIRVILKSLRKQNNWTQKQLAEVLQASQSKVSKLEKMNEPKSNLLSTLVQISNVSGLTLDEIIKNDKPNASLKFIHLKKAAEKLTDEQLDKLIEFIEKL